MRADALEAMQAEQGHAKTESEPFSGAALEVGRFSAGNTGQ